MARSIHRYRNEELMSKVAVMMSENRVEGQMSSHFGKAKWVMFVDTDNPVPTFQKNEAQNGKGAVAIVLKQECTDVILADIGDGALGHLQAAHIHTLATPAPIAGDEALRMFKEGQLHPVPTGSRQRDMVRDKGAVVLAEMAHQLLHAAGADAYT
jgi:predicted Fe-Mo cluster-binding NifX family protein